MRPLFLILSAAVLLAGPRDIRGHWVGTSTCIKADWNSACNDEQVLYDFAAGADSDHVILHASKLVNGVAQPMYDLPFTYDAAATQWNGDFANSRVKIRWSYRVHGDSLAGEVVLLPSGQVGRHVVAARH